MDSLLTGYGSDSDESTSSAGVKSGDNQVASISNLLGDGIDSCSSDDDEEVRKRSHPSSSSSNDKDSDAQTKKKQRVDETYLVRNGLPSPRIAPAQTSSMISWTTDYISSQETRSETQPPRTYERFEKLAALHDNKQGWAAHLRNQNEFHNPHFIQSVIEQFGIGESLGSQAVRMTKVKQKKFH